MYQMAFFELFENLSAQYAQQKYMLLHFVYMYSLLIHGVHTL